MRKAIRFLVACAAITAGAALVQAAELATGEWSATVTPPMGQATPATLTVGEADGQLQISLAVMGMNFAFRDIVLTDVGLSFTWTPGVDVQCELELQDDASFDGPCTDTNGGMGRIRMMPPE